MSNIKARGCFLYTNAGRYFDFSTCYSSWVLGYAHKGIQSKAKRFLHRAFPKLHFQASLLKNQLKSLFHYAPALEDYHLFMLSNEGIASLFSAWQRQSPNRISLHKEACCHCPYVPTLSDDPSDNLSDRQFHIQTDAHFFFNGKLKMSAQDDLTNLREILYVNAFYPFIFQSTPARPIDHFKAIIVGGYHPYGLDAYKLIFIRKNILADFFAWGLDENIFQAYTSLCRFSLSMYQWGMAYFQQHRVKIGDLQKQLTNMITHEANHWQKQHWLKVDNPWDGMGFFYRLHWSERAREELFYKTLIDCSTSISHVKRFFFSRKKIFFANSTSPENAEINSQTDSTTDVKINPVEKMISHTSFLGNDSALYIALPWTIEMKHVENRLKEMVLI